jgi:hypothetical protein
MKSQNRAWLLFVLLFLFWGTLPASPFAYFAEMIREWGGLLISQPFMPKPWQAVLIYLLIGLTLATLLLLGRSRNRLYIAGVCALAEMTHHLVICIRTGRIYSVSLAIAIGLALALLFLLIKAKSPALWLSDAFVTSLAAWLIYDGLVYPLSQMLDLKPDFLAPFLPIPEHSLLENLSGVLGLPMVAWALLPVLMAALPLIFLSGNRQKG